MMLKFRLNYYRYTFRIKRWVRNGLELGENVTIMPSVRIDDEYPYLVKIGNNCSLSHFTTILAHDATTFKFTNGHTRVEKVLLHDNVFVAEHVTILPGTTIGPNVLIAAGSVVNKDIPANSCIAGVPARRYQPFDKFIERHTEQISKGGVIDHMDLNGKNCIKGRGALLKILEEKEVAYVKGFCGKFPYTINGSDFI
jgi:maltose O-acetyltransferase